MEYDDEKSKQMAEMYDDASGAIDFDACPTWRNYCHCAKCSVCGNRKHSGIHGPFKDQPPGSKPWGHEFQNH